MGKVFKVECIVQVSEDDVWDYLESQGYDIDELQEQDYQLTSEDWRNTAHDMFENDDFTYYDFNEVRL